MKEGTHILRKHTEISILMRPTLCCPLVVGCSIAQLKRCSSSPAESCFSQASPQPKEATGEEVTVAYACRRRWWSLEERFLLSFSKSLRLKHQLALFSHRSKVTELIRCVPLKPAPRRERVNVVGIHAAAAPQLNQKHPF